MVVGMGLAVAADSRGDHLAAYVVRERVRVARDGARQRVVDVGKRLRIATFRHMYRNESRYVGHRHSIPKYDPLIFASYVPGIHHAQATYNKITRSIITPNPIVVIRVPTYSYRCGIYGSLSARLFLSKSIK